MQFDINAQTRTLQGTGASRRLRAAGKVPGIVYGGAEKPVAIELDHNPLLHALRKEAFQSSVIRLNLDGKKQPVLLRDVQVHAYKKQVLHIDFQRVDDTHEIHTRVPLHFVNGDESPAVKLQSCMISHVLNDVEVKCLAKDLPEFIEVDLKGLSSGHSLHTNDLKLPNGVKIIHADNNPVVATALPIGGASTSEEAAPAAEA